MNHASVSIENARLVARERTVQRLRRELELASALQLRLLPSPAVLHGDALVAAKCVQADWVGGDFYTWSRLGRGRVGVMLGDVSSHGFSAALRRGRGVGHGERRLVRLAGRRRLTLAAARRDRGERRYGKREAWRHAPSIARAQPANNGLSARRASRSPIRARTSSARAR